MSDPNTGTQALLASLSFSLPRQSRQLPREAHKVEENNNAQHGVVRVSSFYFQQMSGKETIDALSDLKRCMGEWRKEHMRLTRPWDQGNTRLLPAVLIPQYLDVKSKFEELMPGKVEEFLAVYVDWEVTAPYRMGSLYRADDFPSRDQCREDIAWNTAMIPLPTGEQWQRISLISADLAADMERSTNEQIARAVEEARKQTWTDVLAPIQHIVDTLSKDKPRIFSSLIGNLNSMLELVPAFNLSGDTDLNQLAAEARTTLSGIDPEELRQDPEVRRQTLQNAQELLTRFAGLGQRKFA